MMIISSGSIDCTIITTGSYDYYEIQKHHWMIGATANPIASMIQEPIIPFSWNVTGYGRKAGAPTWQIGGSVIGIPSLKAVINSSGSVVLVRDTTALVVKVSNGPTISEPGLPSGLTWSPNLSAPSFTHSEFGTSFLTIISAPGTPSILGKSIPRVIGQTRFFLPGRGEPYPGAHWIEPGDGHSTIWWAWTINF